MGPLSEVGDIFIMGSVTNLSTVPFLKRKLLVVGSPCLSLDARLFGDSFLTRRIRQKNVLTRYDFQD